MPRNLVVLLSILFAGPSLAAEVQECTPETVDVGNIPEPWETHSRSFANGAVRIAVLDTVEPAVGAFYLLVLMDSDDPWRRCRIVAAQASGFAALSLDAMQSAYDPATGLRLSMDVQQFDVETGRPEPAVLNVLINQTNGTVTAESGAP